MKNKFFSITKESYRLKNKKISFLNFTEEHKNIYKYKFANF